MSRYIKIFDTTLRDGEQSPGCSMNIQEKLEFAKQLERLNVDIIEAGFPASSVEDFKACEEISMAISNSIVAALARCKKEDIDTAYNAIKNAKHPRLNVFIATSDLHLKHKLCLTREEALNKACECVSYAKSLCDDVEFTAEDATRSDKDYLAQVCSAVIKAGALTVSIPDTVGYSTPNEVYNIIKYLKDNVIGIENTVLAIHCHNDLGMAMGNTLSAVMAGADQVECTINGIGERAGNASLEEIVMAIKTRCDLLDCTMGINTKQIYRTSKLLTAITGVQVPPNKPVVGANAFAHESGIHQHGIMQERTTYEILKPEDIGLVQNNVILGKHSGRHAFSERLIELGYSLNDIDLNRAFEKFKLLAQRKKIVSDRDIEAVIGPATIELKETYRLHSFVINSGTVISATAVVKLQRDDDIIESVARGDGPVDAAFKAIDAIIVTDYHLDNYRLQAVTDGEDALGEVVVTIKNKDSIITGRGISTDVLESSIKSYINALNKALNI